MRAAVLALSLLFAATAVGNCTFSAYPKSGVQSCSNDDPPQCPDGYTCVGNLCFDNAHLPSTGGTGGGNDSAVATPDAPTDAPLCTAAPLACRSGAGKRCGDVTDSCNVIVKCGACISTETCTNHVCAPPCGQANQPCCAGSKCTTTDTVCSNGQCTACGGANQVCCASDVCSATGAKCADTSVDAGRACLLACVTTTGSCNQGSDQDCTLECGPSKTGNKTCTCATSAWKCPTCSYPVGPDYSCYKLPTQIPACDPTTPPTAGATCSVADCSPCGSTAGKGFIDAGGTTRSGYCVCTNNRWNCAVTKDWPCPGNTGC